MCFGAEDLMECTEIRRYAALGTGVSLRKIFVRCVHERQMMQLLDFTFLSLSPGGVESGRYFVPAKLGPFRNMDPSNSSHS